MTLKRFISYSLILHLSLISLILVFPVKKGEKGIPFFARLVAPEDIEINSEEPVTIEKPAVEEAVPLPPSVEKPVPLPKPSEQPPTTMFGSGSQNQQGGGKESVAHGEYQGSTAGIQESKKSEEPVPVIPPGTSLSFPLRRDNLFDRDIIARYSERGDKQEKSSITLEAKEFQSYGYMERLKEKIESIWQYPHEAAARGIYGDLFLNFTISKNGSLESIELVRTSGYKSLDDAAIRALKDAAPYWPLPGDWKKESLTIRGHFIYNFYGIYIR